MFRNLLAHHQGIHEFLLYKRVYCVHLLEEVIKKWNRLIYIVNGT
jgi:hypothetical protein